MSAKILDGRRLARQLQLEIARQVGEFSAATGITPTLAAVLVGDDPASAVYVRNKQKACEKVGLVSRLIPLPASVSDGDLNRVIQELNADERVHGILVQLPLPRQLDPESILDQISPWKDVDAFHPTNVGLLTQGRPRFLPCTPHGILRILASASIEVQGRHAVVIGRSDIVGKPIATLLAARDSALGPKFCNATVTLCHSRTRDLSEHTRQADILVAALGKPQAITGDLIKPGAVVIDVGIHRTGQGLVGDVEFQSVSQVAGAVTPVPGGVGPLTVTMLLENTLRAAQMQTGSVFARVN